MMHRSVVNQHEQSHSLTVARSHSQYPQLRFVLWCMLMCIAFVATATGQDEPMPPAEVHPSQPSQQQMHGMHAHDALHQSMMPSTSSTIESAAAEHAFQRAVDLDTLGQLAVQYQGRIKSFYSHAAQFMQQVTGPRQYNDLPSLYLYMDLMANGVAYDDAPIIYIRKAVRTQLADAIARGPLAAQPNFSEREELLRDAGLISPRWLLSAEASEAIEHMRRDLLRTAQHVNRIDNAMAIRQPSTLAGSLRIVPSISNDPLTTWLNPVEIMHSSTHELRAPITPEQHSAVRDAWNMLMTGWGDRDAEQTNAAIQTLAALLPAMNAELYPAESRLYWERVYFQMRNMTWVWIFYAFALVPMMLFIAFRWPAAHITGLSMFMLAFGLQTAALVLRWYVSGRWPNSNMFEAVTTAAWFGGCGALVLELFVRHTAMRGLFIFGSAVASMVALMCAHFMPLSLDPNISNMMPVLDDVWLYIHTNVIIFAYVLIFMAAVSAGLYLCYRILNRLLGKHGSHEFAQVGGAASLMQIGADGQAYIERKRTTFGQVLDGTTMVLMELSFVLLWAGIAMGAIWADHSWGRPWGWDPKEVFSLNTFLVFAILIHTRLKVRDKGLWTALLAMLGAAVMLFNWIAINFVVVGLHSYA